MDRIAFIGVGVMGKSMVRNLRAAGYEIRIYSRTKEKLQAFLQENDVTWCDSPADCVKGCHVVITMVGYPKDVEAVYFGEGGILQAAEPCTFLIDMTTTDPKLSARIYEAGKARSLHVLDAPVSGGDTGARNAALSIMVGGDMEDFAACKGVFEAMGKNIVYQGKAGSGQHTKMANQIAIAGAVSGVAEALIYAERAGLNSGQVLESIGQGAAGSWQMTNLMPKMAAGDYAPGFFLKHFVKDMKIALEQQEAELPILRQVCAMYEALEREGRGEDGTQAIIAHYRAKEKA